MSISSYRFFWHVIRCKGSFYLRKASRPPLAGRKTLCTTEQVLDANFRFRVCDQNDLRASAGSLAARKAKLQPQLFQCHWWKGGERTACTWIWWEACFWSQEHMEWIMTGHIPQWQKSQEWRLCFSFYFPTCFNDEIIDNYAVCTSNYYYLLFFNFTYFYFKCARLPFEFNSDICLHFCSNSLSHQGAKPKVKEDDFEDLIQGFASRPDKKGPRTIAEMRREEMTKDTDPLKLKVTKWHISIWDMCQTQDSLPYVALRKWVWRTVRCVPLIPKMQAESPEVSVVLCRSWTGLRGRSETSERCCPLCTRCCGRMRSAGSPWAWPTWWRPSRWRSSTGGRRWLSTRTR